MDEIISNKLEPLLNSLIAISKEIKKSTNPISINCLKYDFSKVFDELLLASAKESFFWIFCPFLVYKSTFKNRKNEFLSRHSDRIEKYFIESELESTNNSFRDGILYFSWEIWVQWDFTGSPLERGQNNVNVELSLDFLNPETVDDIKFSQKRKLEFLKKQKKVSMINEKNIEIDQNDNSFPEIFKDGIEEIFYYLEEKYTRDNKSPKAKYSNLYHFLDCRELLVCTQLEYIKFVKGKRGCELSKIQPQSFKYKDKVFGSLERYFKEITTQRRLNKIE